MSTFAHAGPHNAMHSSSIYGRYILSVVSFSDHTSAWGACNLETIGRENGHRTGLGSLFWSHFHSRFRSRASVFSSSPKSLLKEYGWRLWFLFHFLFQCQYLCMGGCTMHVQQYTTRHGMYTSIFLLLLCLTQRAPVEKQNKKKDWLHEVMTF